MRVPAMTKEKAGSVGKPPAERVENSLPPSLRADINAGIMA